ncbi:oxidoreductase [Marinobacter psychrophilus]|uniref:Oxidoreductase n=1 Tax=Marinobacter psychrophilus TaxID=330734 RepID=A0A0H4I0T7_9GAMM|nr:SDR family oxidoreductase [Marinobacter psychrophilus]AKO51200.1 oxidoreductase [Marinobacter psychrophilus]
MSSTNDPINGKIVIITGASSGLGESTARHLADLGAKLVLAARREDRLKSLAEELEAKGAEVLWQVTDVTDRKQVESLAAAAKNKFGRIDVLINNAGLMPLAPLDALKVDEWEQMIDVNIKGVLYGIAAVLPTMREQHSGHVINLSSVAGHKVFPGGAVYCATKYAVRALSEGLRMEAGDEIRSTNISPGAIATELTSTITDPDAAKAAEELYKVAINADSVARAIVFAIEQPHDVDINEIILRPTAQEL